MKYLGQAFKELREARHISLVKASGKQFSPSMLSKFESGKNDISAQKLFIALENTHIEINEFLYLTRGFLKSDLVELQEKIYSLEEKLDYAGLQKLYESELKKQQDQETGMIYALIVKAHLKAFDETVELTAKEETFLYNYLFDTEIWGNYELTLLSICSTLLTPELFTMYARECLRKTDFLGEIKENRKIIHTMLLNGFLLCIDENDFINANYFDKQIQKHFYQESDAYYRIIYLWAKGLFNYKQGQKQSGMKQMKDAIQVLKILDCHSAADYYTSGMQNAIKSNDN